MSDHSGNKNIPYQIQPPFNKSTPQESFPPQHNVPPQFLPGNLPPAPVPTTLVPTTLTAAQRPMQRLYQAAGCTCKPGTRNVNIGERSNKGHKKKISIREAEEDNRLFGEAVADELNKLRGLQAEILKERITRVILAMDNERVRSSVLNADGGVTTMPTRHSGQFGAGFSSAAMPFPASSGTDQRRDSTFARSSSDQSKQLFHKIKSDPFFTSTSQFSSVDRKSEFQQMAEIEVIEPESSISVDINDPGDKLIEWQDSHHKPTETVDKTEILMEIEKEVQEKKKEMEEKEKDPKI